MENTFKKSYTKKMNPDGSFELGFKSKRMGQDISPGLVAAMTLSVYLASCAATYPFMPMERTGTGTLVVNSMYWWISGTILALIGMYLLVNTKDTVLIKPNEGVVFRGNSLPYTDMKVIGVMTQSAGSKTSAYVFAETNGTKAKITRFISPELAKEIQREIQSQSKVNWKPE